MQKQKLYKNPKLMLTNVANELGISSHQFSQLLNEKNSRLLSLLILKMKWKPIKYL